MASYAAADDRHRLVDAARVGERHFGGRCDRQVSTCLSGVLAATCHRFTRRQTDPQHRRIRWRTVASVGAPSH